MPQEELLAAVGLGQLACLRIAVRSRHNRAVLQSAGLYQRLFRLIRVSFSWMSSVIKRQVCSQRAPDDEH